MSNIAEGFERDGSREFRQFLAVAKGSVGELLSHLYIARDQGFLESGEFEDIAQLTRRTGAALGALIRYLAGSSLDGRKFAPRNRRPETRDQKP
jgi:four helix bundle protein